MAKVISVESIGPNQASWDLALDCFNRQLTDTQAIQTVWQAMPPPANLATLATIIGAIYANTYWATSKLDPALLSAALQAALGLNKSDCDRAAKTAFQKWYGLLVRDNFQDFGGIPKPDPATGSPDVIVNGAATLTVQQLITMWNQYVYTPQPGLKNNTYARAASVNIQVPITEPVVRIFFSDAGFNTPPQSWIQLFTFEGASATSPLENMNGLTTIEPTQRSASSQSFNFQPPGAGHYCLVTTAGSEFFTNNPLDQTGNWDSQQWVHYNGAAGWHNVDVPSSNEETLKFYNQDSRPERFLFEAHCSKVPDGTFVTLECADSGLIYPISSGRTKITKDYQVVSAEAELPPNFSGDLKVRFETPYGKLLPEGSSVDAQMHWILPQGHTHYVQAMEQLGDYRLGALGQPAKLGMGNFTFLGASK